MDQCVEAMEDLLVTLNKGDYPAWSSPEGSGWRLLWERLLDGSGKTGHLPGDCTFCRTCTSQTDHSDERSVYRAAGGNKNNLSVEMRAELFYFCAVM